MKRFVCLLILLFSALFAAITVSAQCQGNVYLTSLSWQTANSVHGFTSTELDYCAGLYYDPANWGNFMESYHTGFAVIGESYTQGYADMVPASLSFDFFAPVHNGAYSTNGNHYVIAYYQVYVPVWNNYFWYDPWSLGFGEVGGGNEVFYGPDYYGYWSYASYWVSSPQFVGSTVDTIAYTGQTQCLPGQQFTQTGQACSSIPECQPGQQFTTTGESCPNYVPPPQEPAAQPSVSVILDNFVLRPKGTRGSTNTRVTSCITGVLNPAGRTVKLSLLRDTSLVDYDGGHKDAFHTGSRPLGTFGKAIGLTGADGCFRTTYNPSHISGVYKVKSLISEFSTEVSIGIAFPDLINELEPGANYALIGANDAHPKNHFGTREARDGLILIANDYAAEFYGGTPPQSEKIAFNDMSLLLGGKFDLGKKWAEKGPHDEHREGINCDTRSNNIPQSRRIQLKQIFRNRGSTRTLDETNTSAPHWHLRFEFNYATVENPNSQMQNGIEQNFRAFVEYNDVQRTPSSLVTDVGEVILNRQVTQEEFEIWFSQISNAKAQGAGAFLQEVKTFEKQLFASDEYIARQTTDEQFIQDVFASHLFRQPTPQELTYWLDYLTGLGGETQPAYDPNEPPSRERTQTSNLLNPNLKRQMFLNNFQTLPDFINSVGSMADDSYQEPLH